MMDRIALVCAVELEARPLVERLSGVERRRIGGRPAHVGRLGNREVVVLACGMGKTNAAQAVTALLERELPRGVLGFGVAGAYLGSGLNVGDVAVASVQYYGDEGVETPAGWMACDGIGIPLLQVRGQTFFNEFPVDRASLPAVCAELANPVTGPFVTVSTCSGTTVRGAALAARHGAVCETMEGAAYAHVATLYGVPYLEVRGVSNLVENRDPGRWRLDAAAAAAADAAARSVSVWNPAEPSASA